MKNLLLEVIEKNLCCVGTEPCQALCSQGVW